MTDERCKIVIVVVCKERIMRIVLTLLLLGIGSAYSGNGFSQNPPAGCYNTCQKGLYVPSGEIWQFTPFIGAVTKGGYSTCVTTVRKGVTLNILPNSKCRRIIIWGCASVCPKK